jgi:hypothetical protein
MKQHHFIISFDEITGAWKWDTDAEEARFVDGTIYNESTGSWTSGYLGDGEYEPAEDGLIGQLKHALWTMNLVNGALPQGDEDE